MTVVLSKDYHKKKALEERRILCLTKEEADRRDIRPLRIGVLNVMPKAESYEFSLLYPLGRSVLQIEPIWLRLNTHAYHSSNISHLDSLYISFEEATKDKHLDGLIITGAPVEEMPYEEVTYWDELMEIMTFAQSNIASTLGICWGGMALAKFLGIEKVMCQKKIFGVYETENLNTNHPIVGGLDDIFLCPQSRHSGIDDKVLEDARDNKIVNLLAYNEDSGYTIFESFNQRFLMHLGHPEYEPERFKEEYERDIKIGRKDVEYPVNVNIEKPVNRWRSHRTEFFSQWIKYVYDETPY
ncbi:MAG: homoserine O-succinyltransferase [Nitrospinae bacterium]|nr:homoserine O-succinyltransferase [Nitrospinota bacterium]